MNATAITNALQAVTQKWARQRKAEERDSARAARRREGLIHTRRRTIRDAAFEVLEEAYQKASSGGRYPAHARQIMYAARGAIQEKTGRLLDDQYFCQGLLPDYLDEFPAKVKSWDVVFDARGHFAEPHTGVIVPLGTIGAILFIEKEGFMPLFKAVRLAERYDLAIMSTKGMSVTASRRLVDCLCASQDIPLLVLRDFDKAGFSIAGTLSRDTRRYEFNHRIRVVDLGLRLADVQGWNLPSEDVHYGRSSPARNLRENGATDEEIVFLLDGDHSRVHNYVGRRVELNAFTSGNLVDWIEGKLQEQGVQKVVPDAPTLTTAYRHAASMTLVQRQLDAVTQQAKNQAAQLTVPDTLAEQVQATLKENPKLSWDEVVAALATAAMDSNVPR